MESEGKGARRGGVVALGACLALLCALPPSATAQTPPLSVYGNAEQRGRIHLVIYGRPGAQALIYEQIGGTLLPLRTVDINPVGAAWNLATWRCDRRERRFLVGVANPDGSVSTAAYETRTPSCRERLTLRLPGSARPGARVIARIADRWRIGGIRPRLCVDPPAGRPRCRTVRLGRGQLRRRPRARLGRRGTWGVELRFAGYRLRRGVQVGRAGRSGRRPVAQPRMLLSGDSMMLNIASYVRDRLRGRAVAVSDIRVGTGLSKPGLDWVAKARRQMRIHRPAATVVFIGANDAFDMRTPAGERVVCCYENWIAEYTRRVAAMMRAYRRGGVASSVWLTLPAARSLALYYPIASVNEAIRRAAAVTPGVRVLHLDQLFTPGYRYRADMPVGGRIRRVRADDGLHLSLLGARMAASRVARGLRAAGAL